MNNHPIKTTTDQHQFTTFQITDQNKSLN